MRQLTDEGQRALNEIAARNGVSFDAVQHLLGALLAGQTTQAQFNHPELGGMGQWSQGGMIMVGDMFNNGLKARVDSLCSELAALLRSTDIFRPLPPPQVQSQFQGSSASLFVPGGAGFGSVWPEVLGHPASSGSQNNLRYAFFPSTRRLAIDIDGKLTIYDTGDHQIVGFSQQQQGGDQSLAFTSQHGLVSLSTLDEVPLLGAEEVPQPTPPLTTLRMKARAEADRPAAVEPAPQSSSRAEDDTFTKIERLADLHAKGILTAEEFQTKKTELLSRL